MIFINTEDFFDKVSQLPILNRQQELDYAAKMNNGDMKARERLIEGYLPMVAGHIKHQKPQLQTLGLIIYCLQALERAVDSFNFLQESETFAHRLSWYLRQATANYIVR